MWVLALVCRLLSAYLGNGDPCALGLGWDLSMEPERVQGACGCAAAPGAGGRGGEGGFCEGGHLGQLEWRNGLTESSLWDCDAFDSQAQKSDVAYCILQPCML